MKRNKLLLLLSFLAVVGFAAPSMAAGTLKTMGTHPFYKPPLTSVADLQNMVQKHGSAVKQGFTKAGAADLYPAFVEQLPNAQIETVQVQPGQTLEWMLFRKMGKGPVAVARNVVWGGRSSFEAFKFSIQKDGNEYNFLVPLVCGNIALVDVTAAPVAEVPPPPAPEVVPVAVAPRRALGNPFIIVGYEHQFDPSEYIFGKVGYDFAITDQFHLLPSLGFYGQVHGKDGESSIAVDVLASYYVVKNFAVALGVGFWPGALVTRDQYGRSCDRDKNNVDAIVAAYYDLPVQWLGMKPSIYVEGRNSVQEFDNMNLTARVGGGLMVRF
ncbi:MAG: hypothetical protein LBH14_05320 [Desulfobulbaceae bacterium]|nr:hypothetical protein [Desulfobulbaceae bacterium]